MLKRYRMYYSEAIGKIEMYLPCKVIEMNGEPDYGVGDFRIGQEHNASICWKEVKTSEKYYCLEDYKAELEEEDDE